MGEGRLAHGDAGAGPCAGQRAGAGEPERREGRAAARRSTALRSSAATTIDRATAVQISHCETSSVVVRITVWKMPRTVDRSSRSKDSPVVRTNVLSEKVLGENAEPNCCPRFPGECGQPEVVADEDSCVPALCPASLVFADL